MALPLATVSDSRLELGSALEQESRSVGRLALKGKVSPGSWVSPLASFQAWP